MTRRDPTTAISDAEVDRVTAADVVERLRVILGTQLVAYIAGVSAQSVLSWVGDEPASPPGDTQSRLRSTLRIAEYLQRHEGTATVQSWFMGMNTELEDQAPAKYLRDGTDLVRDAAIVFTAARSFEQA